MHWWSKPFFNFQKETLKREIFNKIQLAVINLWKNMKNIGNLEWKYTVIKTNEKYKNFWNND